MTREEAINNLEDLYNEVYNEDSDGYNYAVAIDMAIEALSAKAEWIPCSERLPKENAKYLVQMSCGIMRVLRWANILEKVDDYDFYNEKHGGWYELDNEWGYCEMHGIVAWMPLPKPYKGGAE